MLINFTTTYKCFKFNVENPQDDESYKVPNTISLYVFGP